MRLLHCSLLFLTALLDKALLRSKEILRLSQSLIEYAPLLILVLLLTPPLHATRQTLSFTGGGNTDLFANVSTAFPVSAFQTAMDDAGNAYAAWSIFNGTNTVIQAAYKPFNGRWQIPGDPRIQANVLSQLGYTTTSFQLVVDRFGNAVIAWQINVGDTVQIQASYKPAGQPYQSPGNPIFSANLLTFNLFNFNYSDQPSVDINAGQAAVTWQVFNGVNTVAQVALRSPGSTAWQTPGDPRFQANNLSYPGFSLTESPLVAVDLLRNVAVAWEIFNGTNTVVQVAQKSPTSAFIVPGNPTNEANVLSPIRANVTTGLQLQIDNGRITVFWLVNSVLQSAFN